MSNPYEDFFNEKKRIKEKNKENFAERTLKYFTLIEEMLGDVQYERSQGYLESVYQFIEDNEFISDKQVDIVQKIYDHPETPF